VRAARWPDPGAVKRLTDLARTPEGRTVEECFPAIKPGTPSYEFAGMILQEYPQSLQSLSIVMRESLRRQPPRSLLVPPRRDTANDPDRLARVFGADPLTAPVPLSLSQRERQVTKRTQLVFEGLHRIEKTWSDDALWFLFSRLTGEDAFLFQHLDQRAQVEGALIDALEDAIRITPFMNVLRKAISLAPYMDDYQRQIILHALEHVKQGEYTLAVSPLLTGLEGSIKQAAVGLSILDEDRWLVGESKNKKNRRHSADAIIKELKLDHEFERFLHRALFGKQGNPVRHGEKPTNTRRSALLAVVGLVGWMDVCLQISASSALANVMSLFLPDAVSRYRQLTGKRGALSPGDSAALTSWSVSTGTLTSSRALAVLPTEVVNAAEGWLVGDP
jgi:hypothetical protein